MSLLAVALLMLWCLQGDMRSCYDGRWRGAEHAADTKNTPNKHPAIFSHMSDCPTYNNNSAGAAGTMIYLVRLNLVFFRNPKHMKTGLGVCLVYFPQQR
jgi:hypothetical protein